MENMNMDFEKYIIFHRGVASASFEAVKDENGEVIYYDDEKQKPVQHLIITYQDGIQQDLGDPYGDAAREYAEKAAEYMAQAEEFAGKVKDSTDIADETRLLLAQLEDLGGIEIIGKKTIEHDDGTTEEVNQYGINFAQVEGLERNDDGDFYVDFASTRGIYQHPNSKEYIVQFSDQNGVEQDELTGEYYVDFDSVKGIEQDETSKEYYVNFDTPIDNVEGYVDTGSEKLQIKGIDHIAIKNDGTGEDEDKVCIDYTDLYNMLTTYTKDKIDAIDGIVTLENGKKSVQLSDNWAMTKMEIDMITGLYLSPDDAAEKAVQRLGDQTSAYKNYVDWLNSLASTNTSNEEDDDE